MLITPLPIIFTIQKFNELVTHHILVSGILHNPQAYKTFIGYEKHKLHRQVANLPLQPPSQVWWKLWSHPDLYNIICRMLFHHIPTQWPLFSIQKII